jgi:SAM-dependent methyltransferase
MAQTGGEQSGVYGSAVAAAGWQRGAAGRADLRPITDRMLDLAGIRPGHRVLDVAAGTGEQTLMAARRVGPDGFVLATDIADRMLAYLDEAARNEGLTNVQTRLVDARLLELERDSFDAAICRLALMLIPERHKALTAIHRALKAGARFAAIVLSTAEKEPHISESLAIARRHLGLPPAPFERAGRSRRASKRFRAFRLPRRGGGNRAKLPTLRLGCRGHGAQAELAARDAPVS